MCDKAPWYTNRFLANKESHRYLIAIPLSEVILREVYTTSVNLFIVKLKRKTFRPRNTLFSF
jgi:hypothetical protein